MVGAGLGLALPSMTADCRWTFPAPRPGHPPRLVHGRWKGWDTPPARRLGGFVSELGDTDAVLRLAAALFAAIAATALVLVTSVSASRSKVGAEEEAVLAGRLKDGV